MDPISNVDRLVLLLRQRLTERSRGARTTQKVSNAEAGARTAVQALAAVDDLDDRQLKRALIQSILVEQFGGELINEAKFQQVVDRVTEAIDGDVTSSGLLARIVAEMRASAR